MVKAEVRNVCWELTQRYFLRMCFLFEYSAFKPKLDSRDRGLNIFIKMKLQLKKYSLKSTFTVINENNKY